GAGEGNGGGQFENSLSELRRPASGLVLRRLRRAARQRPALPGLLPVRQELDLLADDLRRMRRSGRREATHLPGGEAVPPHARGRLPKLQTISADYRPSTSAT